MFDYGRAPRELIVDRKKRVVWRVPRQRGAGLAPLAQRFVFRCVPSVALGSPGDIGIRASLRLTYRR